MSILEQITAVVFDVDDTLVMTAHTGFAKCRRVAEILGLDPPTLEAFSLAYGILSFDDCIRRWHSHLKDPVEYQAIYEQLYVQFPDRPCGQVREVFAQCRGSGLYVGIVTNGPARKTMRKLTSCGISMEDVDGVWHADNLPYCKPDPRTFAPLLAAWNIPSSQVLYVGDALSDLDAAEAAHIRFAAVLTGMTTSSAFANRIAPDHILNSIDDFFYLQASDVSNERRSSSNSYV